MYFPKEGWTLTFNGESVPGNVTINAELFGELICPKKPNNSAPKSIKGDYDLSIHGNKIVLVDNTDGTTVEAKCHPDDDFDIGFGVKEAFKKMNEKREEIRKQKEEEEKKIKVGDWVEVANPGESYTTYSNFFEKYAIEKIGISFRYGVIPNKGIIGKIVFTDDEFSVVQVQEDMKFGNELYTGTWNKCHDCVYLIKNKGLKKVKNPNV